MSTRMLIDARHVEETRVTIIRGNRVEEFDYESAHKQQIKSNVYLAKITRVEPSLQAAFVDYGGNRHGFLAFSEIHPDYYQIPTADREALLAEEAEVSRNVDDMAEEVPEETDEASSEENGDDEDGPQSRVEQIAGEDEIEESIRRNKLRNLRRRYKIQEVIKRRQIMLVQVVKEERGTKGAALTTYLSLPGRYCVLMPNTTHGGGISRKIASPADRKRLKGIIQSLEIPDGMGCIVRTAGANHTKAEIKRDYDYLLRQWEDIRELTLKSVAPTLIYEEGNLIRRSIRDQYTKEVDEILVEGEEGYRHAKDFMKLLIPSHAKKIKQYKDKTPLFHRYQVESQLDSMYSPEVSLKSGGYIVINPTEALVSIDVNSGKATKEHNIEETALNTNLEAADEIARQLRLRDMAGLIVIDFIDMEYRNNNRTVERRMKEALKNDRARIQLGRISSFGLMEMSRQRLRPGILEASTSLCKTCHGTGRVRSIESFVLQILRLIEEECIRDQVPYLFVALPSDAAIYILNKKRSSLTDIEQRYSTNIEVSARDDLMAPQHEIRSGTSAAAEDSTKREAPKQTAKPQRKEQDGGQKPRRKRGGRRRDEQKTNGGDAQQAQAETGPPSQENKPGDQQARKPGGDSADGVKKRRRRGRRGGRKQNTGDQTQNQTANAETPQGEGKQGEGKQSPAAEPHAAAKPHNGEKPADTRPVEAKSADTAGKAGEKTGQPRRRQPRRRTPKAETNGSAAKAAAEPKTPPASVKPGKTEEKSKTTATKDVEKPARAASEKAGMPAPQDAPAGPKKERKGWWQRPFG